jgi:hypothetical protein
MINVDQTNVDFDETSNTTLCKVRRRSVDGKTYNYELTKTTSICYLEGGTKWDDCKRILWTITSTQQHKICSTSQRMVGFKYIQAVG